MIVLDYLESGTINSKIHLAENIVSRFDLGQEFLIDLAGLKHFCKQIKSMYV
jgi:hypothetical protein